ncbi:MAG: hypothetical protein AAFX99_09500 [Myxococcota bacterium]
MRLLTCTTPPSPALVVVMCLMAQACGDANYTPDPQTQADTSGQEGSPDDVEQMEHTLNWCQPQPVAYNVEAIPQLPTGVELEGFCDADPSLTFPEGEITHQYQLNPDTLTLEGFGHDYDTGATFESTFSWDPQGHVRHVSITGTTGFYSSGMGTSHYDLNASGELMHKVAIEMPWLEAPEASWEVLVKEQTWDGQQLLSRTERQGEQGPIVRRWNWRWDDQGQLVHAMLIDTQPEQPSRDYEAHWSYTSHGAPASVERSIDGVIVERQTWLYSDAGTLVSRTFKSSSPQTLAAIHGGEPEAWIMVQGLDDHQSAFQPWVFDPAFEGNPWSDAIPTSDDGCAALPRGAGHGYPDAEPEYHLGVAADLRPYDIGLAYGSDPDLYTRRANDLSWYGHTGIGSGWLAGPASRPPAALPAHIAVTVHYNHAGHMTHEDALVTLSDGRQVTLARTRSLDDEGRIQDDHLHAQLGSEELHQTLLFERDASGALASRELRWGSTRIEHQTWTRDAQSRILQHTLNPTSQDTTSPILPAWALMLEGDRSNTMMTTGWFWRYDGEQLIEWGGGPNQLTTLVSYDDNGRLIQTIEREASSTVSERTQQFNARNQPVEECIAWNGQLAHCTSTTYDHHGRIAWRELQRPDQPPILIELHRYVCP